MMPVSISSENKIRAKSQFMTQLPYCCSRLFILDLKYCQESFLRDFDVTHLLHAFFSCFLPFKQFLFTRNIATITLGQHILTQGLDVFARDDFGTNGGLNRDIKHL